MYEGVNFHVWGLYVCAVITSMCYMCGDVNFHAWGLYVCGAVNFYVGELYVWGVSFCMWGLYTCVGLTFRVLFPLPCWRKVSWCLCCCVSATYLRLFGPWTFKPFLVLHLLPPGVLAWGGCPTSSLPMVQAGADKALLRAVSSTVKGVLIGKEAFVTWISKGR